GADTARRVADARVVALIERGADDRARPRADARLAGVAFRAGATVVADRSVCLFRVRAGAARRIADTGDVALTEGGADDRIPRTDTGLTGVGLGAGVAVVAGRAVGLVGVGADTARRVADARIVALIEGGADDRIRPRADARLAGVTLRARVAVVAGRGVGLGRGRAGAGGGLAGARVVALIEGGADDLIRHRADARLAGVTLRARVAVVAGRGVGLVRVRAGAGGRLTGARVVTLIEGGAGDRIRARADAGLAGVALGAGVA